METYELAFATAMVIEAVGVFGATALYFLDIVPSVTAFVAVAVGVTILSGPIYVFGYLNRDS